MSEPTGTLTHSKPLTPEMVDEIRKEWNALYTGEVRLQRAPRWKRILRSPRLFMDHYRIIRPHATRWQAAELAARSAVLLWK